MRVPPYSVLPALSKIALDDIKLRKTDIPVKKIYICQHELAPEVEKAVCELLINKLGAAGRYCDLDLICMSIAEDICVHCDDYLAYANMAVPSGWDPAKAIGMSFYDLHKEIPSFPLKSSKKLLATSIYKGPFYRTVDSLIFSDNIDHHPLLTQAKFDKARPYINLKREHQYIIGLPQAKSLLFILRQELVPLAQLDRESV